MKHQPISIRKFVIEQCEQKIEAWCWKCQRKVSRVGYLETDDFNGYRFIILCHGDRREFTVSIADIEMSHLVSATFFDEGVLPDTRQIGHIKKIP